MGEYVSHLPVDGTATYRSPGLRHARGPLSLALLAAAGLLAGVACSGSSAVPDARAAGSSSNNPGRTTEAFKPAPIPEVLVPEGYKRFDLSPYFQADYPENWVFNINNDPRDPTKTDYSFTPLDQGFLGSNGIMIKLNRSAGLTLDNFKEIVVNDFRKISTTQPSAAFFPKAIDNMDAWAIQGSIPGLNDGIDVRTVIFVNKGWSWQIGVNSSLSSSSKIPLYTMINTYSQALSSFRLKPPAK